MKNSRHQPRQTLAGRRTTSVSCEVRRRVKAQKHPLIKIIQPKIRNNVLLPIYIVSPTNARVCYVFITYSLSPTCFNSCRDYLQAKLQEY